MTQDKLDDILYELDFDDIGELKNDKYTIVLNDSDDYAYYYTLLDHNENIDLVDSSSVSTEFLNVITYEGNNYIVSLNANFNDNYYNVTIEDLK